MAGRGKGTFPASVGQKAGLEIFRIENMNPVAVDEKETGSFYGGDCYIVLHTFEKNRSLNYDLFFWLGTDSSKDEQGAVAYRSVELDDKLGGKPVQHREVMGHESPEFVSLFGQKGIKVMNGGVASAFTKVDHDKYDPRLLQCKGKRNIRVTQVELKSSSLNQGDCFILDLGKTLFLWNGKDSNKYERVKALETITEIRNTHGGPGKCALHILDSADNNEQFWKVLGNKNAVKSAAQGGNDDEIKQVPSKLFSISDASGKLETKLVGEGKLEKAMLNDQDCFLVDTGNEIYVWVGKGATKQERAASMTNASAYLEQNGRPSFIPIARMAQGGETAAFKSHFVWPAEGPKKKFGGEEKKVEKKDDTSALFGRSSGPEEEKVVDKGDGKVEIWRINNFKLVEVPKEIYGQFYAGDSYIILYSYKQGTKPAWIIYFWQGKDSSSDEKGASALLTKQMDDERGGEPVQARVEQGREPKHFLTLFKGKMIVHQGGFASAFKNKKETDTTVDASATRLYHIKGTTALNTKAVEVAPSASNLNSGDVFALLTADTAYIWAGKGSSVDEKKVAESSIKQIQGERKVVEVVEGSEDDGFWEALGGKAEYASASESAEGQRDPRLFQCSTVTGAFKVQEVFNFVQDDLINDDVMLLDLYSELFVWVGKDSTKEEKDKAFQLALDYVKNATDGRPPSIPTYKVNAGMEPPNFTACFQGWDAKKAAAAGGDVYAAAVAAAKAGGGEMKVAQAQAISSNDIGYLDWKSTHFDIAKLQTSPLPDKVNPAERELYLNDGDFEKIFKMKKDAWVSQPKWKKDQVKKANKLF